MGSQDQTPRKANLHTAVAGVLAEKQQAADEAARPERERIEAQTKQDAALFNTAGWLSLTDARRARAINYVGAQAQGGGNDAA